MATLGNTKYNSASASTFVADTSISAQNIVIKKSTSITHLDTTGISAANAFLTGTLTSANANITSLSASSFSFLKGFATLNPGIGITATASLGSAQAGIVNVINPGLVDTQDFNITVETAKVSSVSSVINATFQTAHDFSSGITLKTRITSIETGKFNYGIYVADPLGSAFNDNFALHFTIIN